MATLTSVPVKIAVCKSALSGGEGLPVMAITLKGKSTIPRKRKPQALRPPRGAVTIKPSNARRRGFTLIYLFCLSNNIDQTVRHHNHLLWCTAIKRLLCRIALQSQSFNLLFTCISGYLYVPSQLTVNL